MHGVSWNLLAWAAMNDPLAFTAAILAWKMTGIDGLDDTLSLFMVLFVVGFLMKLGLLKNMAGQRLCCPHSRLPFVRVFVRVPLPGRSQKDDNPFMVIVLVPAGGEGGIRTLGTLRYTAFPMLRNRPLCHLSLLTS